MSGGLSGGTVASGIEMFSTVSADAEARKAMNDPYTLTPDRAAEPELGGQPDIRWRRGGEVSDALDGYWLAPFVMAGPNSRIVRRSNALLDYAYGRRLEYGELMSVGRSVVAPVAAALATVGNAATTAFASRYFNRIPRSLLERMVPKPGTGPSEQVRDNGHYTVETFTTTTTGAHYRARLSQRGDYGYKATSVLLGECGLALALDRDKLADLHGVLTPAAAIGDALLARFPSAEVSLETTRLD
jgi:short subunit dehydrogenase-like uncharacterized protein